MLLVISNELILQWASLPTTDGYVTLPISYENGYSAFAQLNSKIGQHRVEIVSLSRFVVYGNVASTFSWVTIGY